MPYKICYSESSFTRKINNIFVLYLESHRISALHVLVQCTSSWQPRRHCRRSETVSVVRSLQICRLHTAPRGLQRAIFTIPMCNACGALCSPGTRVQRRLRLPSNRIDLFVILADDGNIASAGRECNENIDVTLYYVLSFL